MRDCRIERETRDRRSARGRRPRVVAPDLPHASSVSDVSDRRQDADREGPRARGGRIALTFDDGPDPVWTPRVLDALETAGAQATFFVVAPLAAGQPELLREVEERGHGLALHCHQHQRHDRMTAQEVQADAAAGLDLLRGLGHEVRDWRTPWGVVTGDTERAAASLGLRLVGWTADSEDWRGDDPETMLGRLATGVAPGAVVLMHDGTGPSTLR